MVFLEKTRRVEDLTPRVFRFSYPIKFYPLRGFDTRILLNRSKAL